MKHLGSGHCKMKHLSDMKIFFKVLTDDIPLSKDGNILAGSHYKMTHLGSKDTKLSAES